MGIDCGSKFNILALSVRVRPLMKADEVTVTAQFSAKSDNGLVGDVSKSVFSSSRHQLSFTKPTYIMVVTAEFIYFIHLNQTTSMHTVKTHGVQFTHTQTQTA